MTGLASRSIALRQDAPTYTARSLAPPSAVSGSSSGSRSGSQTRSMQGSAGVTWLRKIIMAAVP
jgi:hypothetical protein